MKKNIKNLSKLEKVKISFENYYQGITGTSLLNFSELFDIIKKNDINKYKEIEHVILDTFPKDVLLEGLKLYNENLKDFKHGEKEKTKLGQILKGLEIFMSKNENYFQNNIEQILDEKILYETLLKSGAIEKNFFYTSNQLLNKINSLKINDEELKESLKTYLENHTLENINKLSKILNQYKEESKIIGIDKNDIKKLEEEGFLKKLNKKEIDIVLNDDLIDNLVQTVKTKFISKTGTIANKLFNENEIRVIISDFIKELNEKKEKISSKEFIKLFNKKLNEKGQEKIKQLNEVAILIGSIDKNKNKIFLSKIFTIYNKAPADFRKEISEIFSKQLDISVKKFEEIFQKKDLSLIYKELENKIPKVENKLNEFIEAYVNIKKVEREDIKNNITKIILMDPELSLIINKEITKNITISQLNEIGKNILTNKSILKKYASKHNIKTSDQNTLLEKSKKDLEYKLKNLNLNLRNDISQLKADTETLINEKLAEILYSDGDDNKEKWENLLDEIRNRIITYSTKIENKYQKILGFDSKSIPSLKVSLLNSLSIDFKIMLKEKIIYSIEINKKQKNEEINNNNIISEISNIFDTSLIEKNSFKSIDILKNKFEELTKIISKIENKEELKKILEDSSNENELEEELNKLKNPLSVLSETVKSTLKQDEKFMKNIENINKNIVINSNDILNSSYSLSKFDDYIDKLVNKFGKNMSIINNMEEIKIIEDLKKDYKKEYKKINKYYETKLKNSDLSDEERYNLLEAKYEELKTLNLKYEFKLKNESNGIIGLIFKLKKEQIKSLGLEVDNKNFKNVKITKESINNFDIKRVIELEIKKEMLKRIPDLINKIKEDLLTLEEKNNLDSSVIINSILNEEFERILNNGTVLNLVRNVLKEYKSYIVSIASYQNGLDPKFLGQDKEIMFESMLKNYEKEFLNIIKYKKEELKSTLHDIFEIKSKIIETTDIESELNQKKELIKYKEQFFEDVKKYKEQKTKNQNIDKNLEKNINKKLEYFKKYFSKDIKIILEKYNQIFQSNFKNSDFKNDIEILIKGNSDFINFLEKINNGNINNISDLLNNKNNEKYLKYLEYSIKIIERINIHEPNIGNITNELKQETFNYYFNKILMENKNTSNNILNMFDDNISLAFKSKNELLDIKDKNLKIHKDLLQGISLLEEGIKSSKIHNNIKYIINNTINNLYNQGGLSKTEIDRFIVETFGLKISTKLLKNKEELIKKISDKLDLNNHKIIIKFFKTLDNKIVNNINFIDNILNEETNIDNSIKNLIKNKKVFFEEIETDKIDNKINEKYNQKDPIEKEFLSTIAKYSAKNINSNVFKKEIIFGKTDFKLTEMVKNKEKFFEKEVKNLNQNLKEIKSKSNFKPEILYTFVNKLSDEEILYNLVSETVDFIKDPKEKEKYRNKLKTIEQNILTSEKSKNEIIQNLKNIIFTLDYEKTLKPALYTYVKNNIIFEYNSKNKHLEEKILQNSFIYPIDNNNSDDIKYLRENFKEKFTEIFNEKISKFLDLMEKNNGINTNTKIIIHEIRDELYYEILKEPSVYFPKTIAKKINKIDDIQKYIDTSKLEKHIEYVLNNLNGFNLSYDTLKYKIKPVKQKFKEDLIKTENLITESVFSKNIKNFLETNDTKDFTNNKENFEDLKNKTYMLVNEIFTKEDLKTNFESIITENSSIDLNIKNFLSNGDNLNENEKKELEKNIKLLIKNLNLEKKADKILNLTGINTAKLTKKQKLELKIFIKVIYKEKFLALYKSSLQKEFPQAKNIDVGLVSVLNKKELDILFGTDISPNIKDLFIEFRNYENFKVDFLRKLMLFNFKKGTSIEYFQKAKVLKPVIFFLNKAKNEGNNQKASMKWKEIFKNNTDINNLQIQIKNLLDDNQNNFNEKEIKNFVETLTNNLMNKLESAAEFNSSIDMDIILDNYLNKTIKEELEKPEKIELKTGIENNKKILLELKKLNKLKQLKKILYKSILDNLYQNISQDVKKKEHIFSIIQNSNTYNNTKTNFYNISNSKEIVLNSKIKQESYLKQITEAKNVLDKSFSVYSKSNKFLEESLENMKEKIDKKTPNNNQNEKTIYDKKQEIFNNYIKSIFDTKRTYLEKNLNLNSKHFQVKKLNRLNEYLMKKLAENINVGILREKFAGSNKLDIDLMLKMLFDKNFQETGNFDDKELKQLKENIDKSKEKFITQLIKQLDMKKIFDPKNGEEYLNNTIHIPFEINFFEKSHQKETIMLKLDKEEIYNIIKFNIEEEKELLKKEKNLKLKDNVSKEEYGFILNMLYADVYNTKELYNKLKNNQEEIKTDYKLKGLSFENILKETENYLVTNNENTLNKLLLLNNKKKYEEIKKTNKPLMKLVKLLDSDELSEEEKNQVIINKIDQILENNTKRKKIFKKKKFKNYEDTIIENKKLKNEKTFQTFLSIYTKKFKKFLDENPDLSLKEKSILFTKYFDNLNILKKYDEYELLIRKYSSMDYLENKNTADAINELKKRGNITDKRAQNIYQNFKLYSNLIHNSMDNYLNEIIKDTIPDKFEKLKLTDLNNKNKIKNWEKIQKIRTILNFINQFHYSNEFLNKKIKINNIYYPLYRIKDGTLNLKILNDLLKNPDKILEIENALKEIIVNLKVFMGSLDQKNLDKYLTTKLYQKHEQDYGKGFETDFEINNGKILLYDQNTNVPLIELEEKELVPKYELKEYEVTMKNNVSIYSKIMSYEEKGSIVKEIEEEVLYNNKMNWVHIDNKIPKNSNEYSTNIKNIVTNYNEVTARLEKIDNAINKLDNETIELFKINTVTGEIDDEPEKFNIKDLLALDKDEEFFQENLQKFINIKLNDSISKEVEEELSKEGYNFKMEDTDEGQKYATEYWFRFKDLYSEKIENKINKILNDKTLSADEKEKEISKLETELESASKLVDKITNLRIMYKRLTKEKELLNKVKNNLDISLKDQNVLTALEIFNPEMAEELKDKFGIQFPKREENIKQKYEAQKVLIHGYIEFLLNSSSPKKRQRAINMQKRFSEITNNIENELNVLDIKDLEKLNYNMNELNDLFITVNSYVAKENATETVINLGKVATGYMGNLTQDMVNSFLESSSAFGFMSSFVKEGLNQLQKTAVGHDLQTKDNVKNILLDANKANKRPRSKTFNSKDFNIGHGF